MVSPMGLCDELRPVDGIDFWSTAVTTRVPHTAASLMGVSHCLELAAARCKLGSKSVTAVDQKSIPSTGLNSSHRPIVIA